VFIAGASHVRAIKGKDFSEQIASLSKKRGGGDGIRKKNPGRRGRWGIPACLLRLSGSGLIKIKRKTKEGGGRKRSAPGEKVPKESWRHTVKDQCSR